MKSLPKIVLLAALALLPLQVVWAEEKLPLPRTDEIRLDEAARLAAELGEEVWKGWSAAPFAVLLITPEREFLLRHPKPPADFRGEGGVLSRTRTLSPGMLATFPFEGTSTIVVGQAESTFVKTSTPWVLTVLHEHFHQLQQSRPGYFQDVNSLGLSGDDQTGMWMLNYPFPYKAPAVAEQFSAMSRRLAVALRARGKADFRAAAAAYLQAKQDFKKLLSEKDYRYFSLQLWQEGLARYTECRVARLAAAKAPPGAEFKALPDFTSYERVATSLEEGILARLLDAKLADDERNAFYAVGAGEGLLLDELSPGWQDRYFRERFQTDSYFPAER